jgi:two-component system, response regulator PdtaR
LREFTALEPSPVVLVIENDVLKRLALASELRMRGLQVFEAADATEGMVVLEKIAVDVVLSDASLLRAAELAQWVREHQLPTRFVDVPATGRTSIVASSDMSTAGSQEPEHSGVVLIVEEDVFSRLTTASGLRDAGFEVLEAANADEAVIVLNALRVDALISDVEIPGRMDGLALAKWVQDRRLNTKVVLTFRDEQSLGEAEKYAYFLAKPYDDVAIERILRRVLTH